MRITTKSEYALNLMIDLAKNPKSNIIDISKRQNISIHYIEQLMRKLERSRLVTSKKEKNSLTFLYELKKPSNQITTKEIFDSVGEHLNLSQSVSECKRDLSKEAKETKIFFNHISDTLNDTLVNKKLSSF